MTQTLFTWKELKTVDDLPTETPDEIYFTPKKGLTPISLFGDGIDNEVAKYVLTNFTGYYAPVEPCASAEEFLKEHMYDYDQSSASGIIIHQDSFFLFATQQKAEIDKLNKVISESVDFHSELSSELAKKKAEIAELKEKVRLCEENHKYAGIA